MVTKQRLLLTAPLGEEKTGGLRSCVLPVRRPAEPESLQQQVLCSLQGSLAFEGCPELWANQELRAQWVRIP